MTEDYELLRGYVTDRSQDAFRRLVERHLPMVHATAWRIAGDTHSADEIAQNVFVTLAQKASSIRPPQRIGGWLYTTARNLAMHAVRAEQRRRQREQTAVTMQTLTPNSETGPSFDELEPAMEQLAGEERDVLVLRYLENRSLREVGLELGVSEDAARMRVHRALDQLREVFGRRGIVTSSTVLAAALGVTTAPAIPIGLASTISAGALAASGSAATVTTVLSWLNTKVVASMIGAGLLAGSAVHFWQQPRIAQLQNTNQRQIAEQIAERGKMAAELETAQTTSKLHEQELQQLRQNARELAQLRNEVGLLHDQQRQAAQAQPASSVSHQTESAKGTITYNFNNMPVDQILDMYKSMSGLELVLDSRAQSKMGVITILTHEPLTQSGALKFLQETLIAQKAIVITQLDDKKASVTFNDALPITH